MIGLFLGTSEGADIVDQLNEYTDNLYISTATEYGGKRLKKYKYQILNTSALDKEDIEKVVDKHSLNMIIDASHPYANIITDNLKKVCNLKDIKYIRYERPSLLEEFLEVDGINIVEDYISLAKRLHKVDGNIMNTTGSNSASIFKNMNLKNRIIYKVLPTKEVLEKLYYLEIPISDVVAVYGGGSKEFNKALFKEFNIEAVVMKDSGRQGKTKEKIEAALELGIQVFIIDRKKTDYDNIFDNVSDLVKYIKSSYYEGERS